MKELAIHCSIYLQNEDGWNEDSPDDDAEKVLKFISEMQPEHFDWQIYEAEVRDV